MRILFWSLTFWPDIGGIEVLAAKLLPALRQCGYQFMVVTPQTQTASPRDAQYQGIPITRYTFQNSTEAVGIDHVVEMRRKITELKCDFAPDLVHINGVGACDFFHQITSHVHPAPLLVTLHGEWLQRIDAIVSRTLRQANWVAGCSAAILDRGRQLVPEIAARSSIIYNGLQVPPLAPQPLCFDPPRILCLGRLVSEKGIDLALKAFVAILDRFPQARLIVGGNGPLRPELQHQATGYHIGHAVDFLGWVQPDEVPSLINGSTLVLMPSREDSMPLVALEAGLMGRPVVATNVGGIPEVVIHEQTGILVEPEDSDAIAAGVVFLLSHRETARQMGEAARRRIEEAFSWERHVDAYDALYKRLIGEAETKASCA